MAASPSVGASSHSVGSIQDSEFNEETGAESPVGYRSPEEALTMWAIGKKRMEMLCSSNRFSCSMFLVAWKRHQLATEKGAMILLILAMCVNLMNFASINNIVGSFFNALEEYKGDFDYTQTYGNVLRTFAIFYVSFLLYPVAGWLGDVKVGRHKMIVTSLIILFTSYTLAAFYFSFYQYLPQLNAKSKMLFTLTFCLSITIGNAGFSSNALPFGADQLLYGPAEQVSSYFSWYVWTYSAARLLMAISFGSHTIDVNAFIVTFIGACLMAAALIVNMCFKKWFFIENERRNPLKDVFDVIRFGVFAQRPQRVSAFGYDGRDAPSWIDLAKSKHGGPFEGQTVEDVKSFLSLLPLVVMCGISYFFIQGSRTSLVFQATSMSVGRPLMINHNSMGVLSTVLESIITLFLIPVIDQVIFPLLRDFIPSALKRIGIGLGLLAFSSFISMLYEAVKYHVQRSNYQCMFSENNGDMTNGLSLSFWLFLIPQFFISVSVMLITIASFEFFYTQSPHRMRGMMIGLLIFSKGLLGGLFTAFQTVFLANSKTMPQEQPCRIWYYVIMLVATIIVLIIFVSVTLKYKRRTRAGMEDSGQFYLITSRRS